MIITKIGKDIVRIDEHNMNDESLLEIDRIHVIKLDFFSPTREKIENVLETFPRTNRFVISDNIKFYNAILKRTNKKYYVSNSEGVGFISFFRKNNKVLLDMTKLSPKEKQFVMSSCLADVLRNIEIILIEKEDFEDNLQLFEAWRGNVIIYDSDYKL